MLKNKTSSKIYLCENCVTNYQETSLFVLVTRLFHHDLLVILYQHSALDVSSTLIAVLREKQYEFVK